MFRRNFFKPHKDREDKSAHEPAVKKESKHPQPPRPSHPAGPHDPLAIRTVVVSGLPSNIDSKTLWKKVRKYDGAEKVEWPAKIREKEDPSAGLFSLELVYVTYVDLTNALQHMFCSQTLQLHKRLSQNCMRMSSRVLFFL